MADRETVVASRSIARTIRRGQSGPRRIGARGLSVGFTYAFAPGTKAFPKGGQLVTYALFSKS